MRDHREALIEYVQGLEIIDTHEHLRPEAERVGRPVDVLTLLSTYAWCDMVSAGMPTRGRSADPGNNYLTDTDTPLDERWRAAWPYLQQIKYGTYYRATAITLSDIYGIEELGESNYHEASERIQAANIPGLYREILRRRCKIKTTLVQNEVAPEQQEPADLLTPICSVLAMYGAFPGPVYFGPLLSEWRGCKIEDFDTYLAAMLGHIADGHARGDKGMKIGAVPPYAKPDIKAARKAYVDALSGGPVADVLQWTVIEALLEKAAEWDWPVPVHCGVWLDYRRRDPKHAIDMIMKHPGVRFDLYHLGAPFVRDCIFIAKNFPNAYLNLCWCYLLSEEMTRRALGEILDTVPINKVFAFGGDEVLAVENVYGHLVMAREVLAEALARRIAQGRMDMDGAKQVARMWLYENPARFYGLDA